ncbi:META domain-containing protein, partial [Clostridium sp. HCS.1]|uniref:META domain-containing protein n=1 Tax=Clostridium sp. HCS.1 TaxID=3238594 RepID=UPI003A10373D
NVLNGNIIVNLDKGHGIEFQNLATTRMTCPDIATEQAFLLALEQVSTAMSGKNTDSASLCNASVSPVITMVRLAANELVDE